MTILKKTFYGVMFGCCFSLLTAFDGVMRLVSSSHITGSLNYFFAAMMCVLLLVVLLFRINGLVSELQVFDTFMTCVSALAFGVVAGIMVLVNQNIVAFTVELTYLIMFSGAFLFYRVFIARDPLICHAFFSSVILISGLILPLLALGLSWFSNAGRFEGIYGASSLSGNIAALIGAYIVTSQLNWYRRLLFVLVFCVCMMTIVLTGTRSALLIILVACACKVATSADRHTMGWGMVGVVALGLLALWLISLFGLSNLAIPAAGSSRVLSVQDQNEVGSLATRLQWIFLILDHLRENGVLGGFGPGQAREYIGVFLHFDLLKTYYDYSILGFLALVSAAYYSCRKSTRIASLCVMLIMLLLSLHNLVVSPILLLFSIPFLVTEKYALYLQSKS